MTPSVRRSLLWATTNCSQLAGWCRNKEPPTSCRPASAPTGAGGRGFRRRSLSNVPNLRQSARKVSLLSYLLSLRQNGNSRFLENGRLLGCHSKRAVKTTNAEDAGRLQAGGSILEMYALGSRMKMSSLSISGLRGRHSSARRHLQEARRHARPAPREERETTRVSPYIRIWMNLKVEPLVKELAF